MLLTTWCDRPAALPFNIGPTHRHRASKPHLTRVGAVETKDQALPETNHDSSPLGIVSFRCVVRLSKLALDSIDGTHLTVRAIFWQNGALYFSGAIACSNCIVFFASYTFDFL